MQKREQKLSKRKQMMNKNGKLDLWTKKESHKKKEKLNKKHDKQIIEATKTALVANVQNDVAQNSSVEEVLTSLKDGTSIEEEINSLKLPFELQVPEIKPEDEELKRLLCSDGSCDDDFESDSFISGLIKQELFMWWDKRFPAPGATWLTDVQF